MKKLLSLVLLASLLCGCLSIPAYAEPEFATRNSAYFISYGTTLSKHGSGKIKIVFQACATRVATSVGVASYHVEKLTSEGKWESCTGLLDGKTGSNVGSYTYSDYFYGIPGETYHVVVTFYCAMNGGAEHKTYTSGRITAK